MPTFNDLFFATDTNYPTGSDAWSSTPTKVEPPSGALAVGITPGDQYPAQYVNYLLNSVIKAGQSASLQDAYDNQKEFISAAYQDPYASLNEPNINFGSGSINLVGVNTDALVTASSSFFLGKGVSSGSHGHLVVTDPTNGTSELLVQAGQTLLAGKEININGYDQIKLYGDTGSDKFIKIGDQGASDIRITGSMNIDTDGFDPSYINLKTNSILRVTGSSVIQVNTSGSTGLHVQQGITNLNLDTGILFSSVNDNTEKTFRGGDIGPLQPYDLTSGLWIPTLISYENATYADATDIIPSSGSYIRVGNVVNFSFGAVMDVSNWLVVPPPTIFFDFSIPVAGTIGTVQTAINIGPTGALNYVSLTPASSSTVFRLIPEPGSHAERQGGGPPYPVVERTDAYVNFVGMYNLV